MFKQYFFKVLNYLPLQKSKYIACIVEGLANYFDKIRKDIIFTRNQYIIPLADKKLISKYGSSRNILRSKFDSDENYYNRVLNAYNWISLAGKEQGLIKILNNYGFQVGEFKNLGLENKEKWAEFEFKYPNKFIIEDVERMVAVINQYKPARSRLASMITPYEIKGNVYIYGIYRIESTIKSIISPIININSKTNLYFSGIVQFPFKIVKI